MTDPELDAIREQLGTGIHLELFRRVARAVAEAERAACLAICQKQEREYDEEFSPQHAGGAATCAALIEARSNEAKE